MLSRRRPFVEETSGVVDRDDLVLVSAREDEGSAGRVPLGPLRDAGPTEPAPRRCEPPALAFAFALAAIRR